MEVMHADPRRVGTVEERFTGLCLRVFGPEQVQAVVSHGSAVKGGLIPGFSDMDFMVFLAPDRFGPYGLRVDDAMAMQEGIDGLGAERAGFDYVDAHFYDAGSPPDWWTGPVPGAYRLLHGGLPAGVEADAGRLREAGAKTLQSAGRLAAADLAAFSDAPNRQLRRRVRLLATRVTPVLFAAAAARRDDVMAVWAADKVTVLSLFEAAYGGDPQADLPRRFYEGLWGIGAEEAAPEEYRRVFRLGVEFLFWADRLGRDPGGQLPAN